MTAGCAESRLPDTYTVAILCLGLPDVTPCGIRVGFSISHYIWHPSSGWRRRLVIFEPRGQPDVGTAAGPPWAPRWASQADRHHLHHRQCLHSFATSRFPPPRRAPVVAGRRASGPSRPAVRRDSHRPLPGAPIDPPGGTSPAARSTMPASPAPGTDRLPPLGAVGPEVFGPAAPAPRRRCEL